MRPSKDEEDGAAQLVDAALFGLEASARGAVGCATLTLDMGASHVSILACIPYDVWEAWVEPAIRASGMPLVRMP